MCRYRSFLVIRPSTEGARPDILWHPGVDSHSDLIEKFKIRERASASAQDQFFARIELTPASFTLSGILAIDKWTLELDEEREPVWWPEVRDYVDAYVRAEVHRSFTPEHRGEVVCSTGAVELKGTERAFLFGSACATLWGSSTATLESDYAVAIRRRPFDGIGYPASLVKK